MTRLIGRISLAFVVLLLASCASQQTPRSVPEGTRTLFLGTTVYTCQTYVFGQDRFDSCVRKP